jgi:hypothetical protein
VDSLDQATKRYHEGLREFFKGDAGPVLQMFSRREDVVLCNPFHPFARGPREVAEAAARLRTMPMGYASSRRSPPSRPLSSGTSLRSSGLEQGLTAARVQVRCVLPRSFAWKTTVGGLHIGTQTR